MIQVPEGNTDAGNISSKAGGARPSLVSVGMPLFNNGETVVRAVNSIRRQTWTNMEIILSDDGSVDETYALVRWLSESDQRIHVYRQEKNLYFQNFGFVLEKATGEYFMWAAGDDYWRPSYVEENLKVLLAHPEVVGSVSRCLFVSPGHASTIAQGTYPLMDDAKKNVETFLRRPVDNTRMYGLFRRRVLLDSFPRRNFHAYDWALSAATLKHGKHYQVDRILMRRDETALEKYSQSVNRDHQFPLFRFFPVLRMSGYLLCCRRIPLTVGIARALLRLNLVKHQEYVRYTRPGLFKWLGPVYRVLNRHVLWRL